ncbi:MAG: DUF4342 domain-containing protein [Devosia sp.]
MPEDSKTAWKTFTDEVEVSGQHLMAEINRLVAEGNVRKLVVKSDAEQVYLTVPLTSGAVAGGLVAISAPWLVILGAIAGLAAHVRIEVVRDKPASNAEADASKGQQPPANDLH